MRRIVPVVDLFSGPGGLAEGFAGFRSPKGRRRYGIALSVEKDRDAHRTVRLRAFFRKFGNRVPRKYYEFLNGAITEEPDWEALHPNEWAAACDETMRMELGASGATTILRSQIDVIRKKHGGRTVLLGGPPCQSYSVIGRSRNVGNRNYNADGDYRQSLYEQYVEVLDQLRPVVAVMENVKGMLSARRNGKPIFPEIMRRLQQAGGTNGYKLFALSARSHGRSWGNGLEPSDFLIRAEEHGVPQSRHRVFVICVRSDLAAALPDTYLPHLEPGRDMVSVKDVIGAMPRLRSRLSRGDTPDAWRREIRHACDLVDASRPPMSPAEDKRFRRELAQARAATEQCVLPWWNAHGNVDLPEGCPQALREWILDENLERLPNNEARGHMASDLARYLFAAAFGYARRRSPTSRDFPDSLAPRHANWYTGKFVDRYRVQLAERPSTTVTSHVAKDGHYFIHPDPAQCRSLTVREVARLQTFPDNYFFHGGRTQQYTQVGNAVPPYLALQIARALWPLLDHHDHVERLAHRRQSAPSSRKRVHRLSHSPGAARYPQA